ncbi:hypothetical protein YC2023_019221 [Brassica napus]
MVSDISEHNYDSDESIGSSEENSYNIPPTIFFKNQTLSYFVAEPLRMLYNFSDLKNECLVAGNPRAHYIEGGNFAEGQYYLDMLSWKTNQDRTTQCLTMLKQSLKAIRVSVKAKYVANTDTMEPLADCNTHAMDSACEDCYYFKKMKEFVDYIRNKKQ